METPRSRRSHLNLSHLSLAPLTSGNPLVAGEDRNISQWQSTSYIQGRSAPTTPGILSRSPSRDRGGGTDGSKSYTQLSFADMSTPTISKTKSTTALSNQAGRRKRGTRDKRAAGSNADRGEWLYRAGTAISSEARESKGQSWLISRASSTSLVADRDEDNNDVAPRLSGELADDGHASPYIRRSRMPSARTSRHASRVGSRADLAGLTPPEEDYFGPRQSPATAGPDFVEMQHDEDEEEDDDDEGYERLQEAEVEKLTRAHDYGFGSIVDRLMGWRLEDDEDGEPEEDELRKAQQERVRKLGARQGEGGGIALEPVTGPSSATQKAARPGAAESESSSGWSDAAWLLSVASKVLF